MTLRRRVGMEANPLASVDVAADGVVVIDLHGLILFNPTCERLFGYAVEELPAVISGCS
jgi:PAS domain-containing protein